MTSTKSLFRFTSILLFIFSCHEMRATHITGGEITYTYSSGDNYTITLKIYRDCGPDNTQGTGFDDPAHVGIYVDDELYDTYDMTLQSAIVSEVPANISNPCLVTPPTVCIEECIYTGDFYLPQNASGYDLVYIRCCRSPAIINLLTPEAQGMTCNTHIPGSTETLLPNNSAIFTNLPPTLLCTGVPFVMDHSATDADGDSLVYQFCWPLNGADEFTPYPDPTLTWDPLNVTWQNPYITNNPIAGAPAFNVNSVTGLFTGTPTTSGKWVYAICVSEFRDGILINTVKRDYMVQILICQQVVTAAFTDPLPCQGLTIQFDNSSLNANSYSWDFGVPLLDSDTSIVTEPVFTYADTGVYQITLIAQPGAPCADTMITELYVNELLSAVLSLDDVYCSEGAMHFDFSLSGNYSDVSDIEWDFPNGSNPTSSTLENPPSFNTSTFGASQNVSVNINDHNCELNLNYAVDVPAMPSVEIIPPPDPCIGLTVPFESNISGANSLTWDFGVTGNTDVSYVEDTEFTFPNYGTYTITLTAENEDGCSDNATLTWVVLDPDPLEMDYIFYEPLPCASDSIVEFEFTGSGATTVAWNLSDGSTGTGSTYQHTFEEQGIYTVELVIMNDICDVEENIFFDVEYNTEVPLLDIRVPNVITPNNDSKNTYFRPFDPDESTKLASNTDIFDYIDQYSLLVYDRWGVLIYESNGNGAWNGTFDSKPVVEGVYYYIIKFREICSGKTVDKAGHVTVMREY